MPLLAAVLATSPGTVASCAPSHFDAPPARIPCMAPLRAFAAPRMAALPVSSPALPLCEALAEVASCSQGMWQPPHAASRQIGARTSLEIFWKSLSRCRASPWCAARCEPTKRMRVLRTFTDTATAPLLYPMPPTPVVTLLTPMGATKAWWHACANTNMRMPAASGEPSTVPTTLLRTLSLPSRMLAASTRPYACPRVVWITSAMCSCTLTTPAPPLPPPPRALFLLRVRPCLNVHSCTAIATTSARASSAWCSRLGSTSGGLASPTFQVAQKSEMGASLGFARRGGSRRPTARCSGFASGEADALPPCRAALSVAATWHLSSCSSRRAWHSLRRDAMSCARSMARCRCSACIRRSNKFRDT
mmetsp:Transcript_10555/g.43632  ORF Transcript_10555/g.43632 Transcript_10555/m.43632 type:complete len:362 (-) Transcript_10555:921-2006(-)